PRIFGGNGTFALGLLLMSGTMLLGTTLSFFLQWLPARRRKRRARQIHQRKLAEARQLLIQIERQERQARCELDPPFLLSGTAQPGYERLSLVPILDRLYDNRDISLWARRPDDPDFLAVRVGMGTQPPRFTVQQPQLSASQQHDHALTKLLEETETLGKRY